MTCLLYLKQRFSLSKLDKKNENGERVYFHWFSEPNLSPREMFALDHVCVSSWRHFICWKDSYICHLQPFLTYITINCMASSMALGTNKNILNQYFQIISSTMDCNSSFYKYPKLLLCIHNSDTVTLYRIALASDSCTIR